MTDDPKAQELKLRTVHRLEPTKLDSMGDIKKGDLFTLGPPEGVEDDPYEDGRDIYCAESDAFPEKPVGNHGIAAFQVGRVGKEEGLPKGVKSIKMTVTLELEDGSGHDRTYEIHPNTFNLAESKRFTEEDGKLLGSPKRVMVVGDVLSGGPVDG